LKNSWDYDFKLNYQGNYVTSSSNTKFLVLIIDVSLSWNAHIDQMMSKLNTACFVIRTIQAIMYPETLRMVYFAYIHSIMSYGIIWEEINHVVIRISKFKKGWLELSQIRECEIHVGTVQKIRNTILIFSYLLNINICDKKQTFILYK